MARLRCDVLSFWYTVGYHWLVVMVVVVVRVAVPMVIMGVAVAVTLVGMAVAVTFVGMAVTIPLTMLVRVAMFSIQG